VGGWVFMGDYMVISHVGVEDVGDVEEGVSNDYKVFIHEEVPDVYKVIILNVMATRNDYRVMGGGVVEEVLEDFRNDYNLILNVVVMGDCKAFLNVEAMDDVVGFYNDCKAFLNVEVMDDVMAFHNHYNALPYVQVFNNNYKDFYDLYVLNSLKMILLNDENFPFHVNDHIYDNHNHFIIRHDDHIFIHAFIYYIYVHFKFTRYD
jgi:hypothetical protein